MKKINVKQQCLVITGASRGIGKATAQLFSNEGWSVINLSRHPCDVANVINITADFSAIDWVDKIRPQLIEILNNPCKIALVHNAATNKKATVQTLSASELRSVLEVNLIAPLQLNQLLMSQMLPGSSIIYIGSTLSKKAVKNAASYVMSKHAILGLMRSTCQDLAGTHIHTSCICPGFTDTAMLREHLQHDSQLLQFIQNQVGAKRLIQPTEIAELIWFCANHEVINGSCLDAHLGQIEQ